tara:strand:- start:2031 stop:2306 length:276 start_codon:yes stop_codon:yes gene_type:complete
MFTTEKWDTPEQEACKEAKANVTDKKQKLFYALEGRRVELMAGNRGDADNWIRRIDQAYLDYSDAVDEWDEARKTLKDSKLAMLKRLGDLK